MTEAPRRPLVCDCRVAADEARLDLLIPPDLFWFRGHFADLPILPGVVQIDWALAFARECLGVDIPAARVFQVKFMATIVPGDRLVLDLRHQRDKGRLDFEYRRDGKACSRGRITVPQ